MSASFSVIIATCLASNSQNIKKTFEESNIRPTTMLSQTASNSSDFQKSQVQFQPVRPGGRFNQKIQFKATQQCDKKA